MTDFRCPECRQELVRESLDGFYCRTDRLSFERIDGIWHFLAPEREAALMQFMQEYRAIRAAEDRAGPDDDFYRALPFRDTTGRQTRMWSLRAASYRKFEKVFLDRRIVRGLRAADLGAGNGWLSYRLAQRGHQVDAVDLQVNDWDGLGCFTRYDRAFRPVRASFDALPFAPGTFDLIVYNASFHYSVDYAATLAHALDVLKPGGVIAVIDTPFYRLETSGRQMVAEREGRFAERYGFPSNALAMENFLTYDRLDEVAGRHELNTRIFAPDHGLRRRLARLRARLTGSRSPAAFPVVLMDRGGSNEPA